jgi:hypothetical protein
MCKTIKSYHYNMPDSELTSGVYLINVSHDGRILATDKVIVR